MSKAAQELFAVCECCHALCTLNSMARSARFVLLTRTCGAAPVFLHYLPFLLHSAGHSSAPPAFPTRPWCCLIADVGLGSSGALCAHSVPALQHVVLLSLLTDGDGFSQQLQLCLSVVNDPQPELLCCRQRSGFPLPLGCAGCAGHSSASQVASMSPGQRALNSQHLHLLLLAAPPSPF